MAIAVFKPTAKPPVRTTLPEEVQAPVNTTMTELIPPTKLDLLLKYVEGYPWSVTWYGQILNENNTLNHFDPNLADLTQSYYEVKDLVLQVSNPLSFSYDQETSITTVNGSSLVPKGVRPNAGDLFLAAIDTGELAVFIVNSVERKTHRKSSIYEIEYVLYAYSSDSPEIMERLKSRINETYFFNKDTNYFNRDVLLKPTTKEAVDQLKQFMRESQTFYFNSFIQKETSSLNLPGTTYSIYDPLLTNFIAKTVSLDMIDVPNYFRPTSTHQDLNRYSILDSLLTRTLPHLATTERHYGYCSTSVIDKRIRLGSLGYTGVDYVLFPVSPNRNHQSPEDTKVASGWLSTVRTDRNYFSSNLEMDSSSNNDETTSIKLLHELEDNEYIVSSNFYTYLGDRTNFENLSYLELLIYKFISREALPKEDLAVVARSYREWSLLHQFYLLPVLWVLCKDAIGE